MVLEVFWRCFGGVLDGFGVVLKVFRRCFGGVLDASWMRFGCVLEVFWECFGECFGGVF